MRLDKKAIQVVSSLLKGASAYALPEKVCLYMQKSKAQLP